MSSLEAGGERRKLLAAYAALVGELVSVCRGHASRGCLGCELCRASAAQLYTVRVYEAAVASEMPEPVRT